MKSGLYYIEVEHIPEAEAAGLLPNPEMQGPEKFIMLTDERMFFGVLHPVDALNLCTPLIKAVDTEPVQIGDYLIGNSRNKDYLSIIYKPKDKEAQPNG